MSTILALIGPFLIRFMSSSVAKLAARAVVQWTFDRIEEEMRKSGNNVIADVLEKFEKIVMADLSGAVTEMQTAVMISAPIAAKVQAAGFELNRLQYPNTARPTPKPPDFEPKFKGAEGAKVEVLKPIEPEKYVPRYVAQYPPITEQK